MNVKLMARLLLALLALSGALVAFNISQEQWTGSSPCPAIVSIPACYVVFAGYCLMAITAIYPKRELFLLAWLPVFLLAGIGAIAELFTSEAVCPHTAGGIPKCYLSLGLMVIIGLVGFFLFKKHQEKSKRANFS